MSELFSPLTIRHVHLRNRIVMPPMVMGHGDEEGNVTDAVLEHYADRAAAGTGLIIVEATAVQPEGRVWPRGLCAYTDAHQQGLARLAERIHREGAAAGIQLVHGGPQIPPDVPYAEPVGPSAVKPSADAVIPRPLTCEEIARIEDAFAAAAGRVAEAGFDVVEVHSAHGYLLDSFLSSHRNLRVDEYGGDLAGRMRALVETLAAVRGRIGTGTLLDCRISIFNKLEEGFTPEDLGILVGGLEEAGIDLLHISTDGAFKGYFETSKTIGHWVKELTDLPIIVAGELGDPRDAEQAIAEGHADLAAVGRAMWEDPQWAQHAWEMLEG